MIDGLNPRLIPSTPSNGIAMDQTPNLIEQLDKLLRARIREYKIIPNPETSTHRLYISYLNAKSRRIKSVPRKVYLSRELLNGLNVLNPSILKGVFNLQELFLRGKDVNPHQSTTIERDYNDRLLNAWDIYHFHLGLEPHARAHLSERFVARTGPLLFAVIRSDEAFFLDIFVHEGAFGRRALLNMIQSNWPHLTVPHRIRGFDNIEDHLTDAEIEIVLRKNGNLFLKLYDGTVVSPLGGGSVAAGSNLRHLMAADHLFQSLRQVQDSLPLVTADLESQFAAKGQALAHPLHFLLEENSTGFILADRKAGFQVWEYKFNPDF